MNDSQLKTIEQIQTFLNGSHAVTFSIQTSEDRYIWINAVLIRLNYVLLNKADKGILRCYLRKTTGYSRQQITRLIQQYKKTGKLERKHSARHRFPKRYTEQDILLLALWPRGLAHTDTLHSTLSGPATKRILQRAYTVYGNPEYERLAKISVAHLYNLRKCDRYTQKRRHFTKTRPTPVKIGERRKPNPEGSPGYIRIDTVHQGDLDGRKGVYHINAVDEVTQFEIVSSVEKISEAYLLPVIDTLLSAFPFTILGFHSDNGSEYVNKQIAKLLNKLLIEFTLWLRGFTKSRSRQTNDNALVEGKNGAVIRKHLGYAHIPQKYASLINQFNQNFLNPYLNFHRPCFFPEIFIDKKGKEKRHYPYERVMTPYEKLKSLPKSNTFLKTGITFKDLDAFALDMSDNESARRLNQAKLQLFKQIDEQEAA